MSIQRRTLLFVTLGLAVWSVTASLTTAYYYAQYVETRKTFEELKSVVINVNVFLDYGNSTQNWHNTTVNAGATAFAALLAIAKNAEYQTFSIGVYVTSINGVKEASRYAWFWYYWNSTWTDLKKAADSYVLRPNDSILWRYASY